MITITTNTDTLFNYVIQRTVYYSRRLNESTQEADIIPMTEDEKDFFSTYAKEAALYLWEKMATFAAADETEPFTISINGYFHKITWKLDEPTGYIAGVQDPLIEGWIDKCIISYIVSEWLRIKGFDTYSTGGRGGVSAWQMEWGKFTETLEKIKSALMYKNTATTTYRTF